MESAYNEKIEHKINQEFQRLKGQCYLDHAGATLYSETQIRNICEDLCNNIFGNPHSLSLHSKHCTDIVDEVRNRILRHFHTSSAKYNLIFTSGATAAIRLLLENFDWEGDNEPEEDEFFDTVSSIYEPHNHRSAYVYTQSNHTSIIGGREIAAERGIDFFCLGYDESFSLFSGEVRRQNKTYSGNSLFAYPAQCNYSGRKYPLEWIEKVQNGVIDSYGMPRKRDRNSRWYVLLDAATYCATNDLDLSLFSPDFVCLSFYKIFGYPTGLGALLVRNKSAHVLRKTYFGGGTVEISLTGQKFHRFRRNLYDRFEDGTLPFLSIVALNHGLKTLERLDLNMKLISQHVFELARYAYNQMKALKHFNGENLIEFYADSDYTDISEQGGIVNFNLLRSNGQYIGYTEALHVANLHNIQFRTGCFCNSGACQRHLRLTDNDLKSHFEAGHVCGDTKDIISGRPTGSIRISFGYMTTSKNIDLLIQVLKDSFLETIPSQITTYNDSDGYTNGYSRITLKKIWTYPIKSCGAMEVESWRLNDKGLEYDREWMIVEETGVCLTQKKEPRMCLILPKLDLEKNTLTLTFRTGSDSITIPIYTDDYRNTEYDICESKVCGDRILGYDCGDEVSDWLSRHLNISGLRLIKQSNEDQRKIKAPKVNPNDGKLSLSNQAQYLLINEQSVRWLQKRIGTDDGIDLGTFAYRFRGNFLIEGTAEFSETHWSSLSIGPTEFKVDGPCGRCQMICIDQYTGEKNRKPIVELSRALNGKMRFGIYLSHLKINQNSILRVGDDIYVHYKQCNQ
ncbi:UNVERIFIED_CONTAM: hypothetical protein PYX00_007094 [Menopon gallinae]|uniref:Molybdenum cofactor sulfurase n=1 Tax=Menopon gallinae TaxID=328185 RepID=A0AAW2HHK3_9NEOP